VDGSSATTGMVAGFEPVVRAMRSVVDLSLAWLLDSIHQKQLSLLEHRVHLRDNIGSNQSVEILPAIRESTENRTEQSVVIMIDCP
jgi:hypothetical protein